MCRTSCFNRKVENFFGTTKKCKLPKSNGTEGVYYVDCPKKLCHFPIKTTNLWSYLFLFSLHKPPSHNFYFSYFSPNFNLPKYIGRKGAAIRERSCRRNGREQLSLRKRKHAEADSSQLYVARDRAMHPDWRRAHGYPKEQRRQDTIRYTYLGVNSQFFGKINTVICVCYW
ncbi:unnamed protein product [Cuscuta europaea]|uniref:Uncharacterized protein n=1 Tax=Cuscuta europaea TaxID=41803 RepID=A0A9P0Z8T3_CUSEU|nr:unnamed protein product [Cuscuta europaea]